MKKISITTSRYLCIDKKIFPKDYSNRVQNLNGQIFLTDSILDIFVLEIWVHSLGWVVTLTSPIFTKFHQFALIWTNFGNTIWTFHTVTQSIFDSVNSATQRWILLKIKDISLSKASMLYVLKTKNIPKCN